MKTKKTLTFLVVFLIAANTFSQADWYVKASGDIKASGSSWENSTTLNKALSLVEDDDIIHLAAGEYIPNKMMTNGTVESEKCFEITKNISLIGGYPANAKFGDVVDANVNQTILNGKITETVNAYHVVVVSAPIELGKSVSINGLIIKGGKANSATILNGFSHQEGGGVIAMNNVLSINNCSITANEASKFAGISIRGSILTINSSQICKNLALTEHAGGIYLENSSFSIDKTLITENSAKLNAGGMYLFKSRGCIDHSVIAGNTANDAAGLQLFGASKLYLYNSEVSENAAIGLAGGIYHRNGSYLQMVNTTVAGNKAGSGSGNGSAIAFQDKAVMDVMNSTISKNSGSSGLYFFANNKNFKARLYNSIISGNAGVDCRYASGTNEGASLIKRQSICADKFYDMSGTLVPSAFFNGQTMLANLANNGGVTSTCKLLMEDSNPAIIKGLTPSEMTTLASEVSLPAHLAFKDQRGSLRSTEKVAMGAYQEATKTYEIKKDLWHLVLYGQGLSEGVKSYPALSHEAMKDNYMIGNQVQINSNNQNFTELAPLFALPSLADVERSFAKSRIDAARCESPIIGAANHIQHKILGNKSILATSCGAGENSIEQLSKTMIPSSPYNSCYLKTLESAAKLAEKRKLSITCPTLFWMQGEKDYDLLTDNKKEDYKKSLLLLKKDMQDEVKKVYSQSNNPFFITYQTGAQYIKGFEETVSMAQLEASNMNKDIICAGPLYQMTDRGGHLDPNGYRWLGEMLGKVFYKTVIEHEDFKPLQPKKITKRDARTLIVDFYVPVKPLVIDTKIVQEVTNYGFAIKDNNVEKSIETVTLGLDGESVIITVSTDFIGDVELNYAGAEVLGHGNLRDSDSYESFYTYVDLDKKTDNGGFFYLRDEVGATLRPGYEPQDEGGVIYNKPYPLYNFGSHFYYKLPAGTSVLIPESLVDDPTYMAKSRREDDAKIIRLTENQFKLTKPWNTMNIYDIKGTRCKVFSQMGIVDISDLPDGLFIIEAFMDGGKEEFKILK